MTITEATETTDTTHPTAMPDLPPGWEWTTIGNLSSIVRGVTYDKSSARDAAADGLMPILRATNIQDGSLVLKSDLIYVPKTVVGTQQHLQRGDVVICTSSGSKSLVGKTGQLHQDWIGSFGAFCAVARFTPEIDNRYSGYFFEAPIYREVIRDKASGVNINNLRHGDIENIAFPLPPLAEQRRIVAAIETQLTRLDAGVAALRAGQARLRRYKAAVLKAACEGRLVPQDPSDEPASALLQRILAERRERWAADLRAKGKDPAKARYEEPKAPDTSDLPELPAGWVWARLDSISEALGGYAFQSKDYSNSGFQILKMGNVKNGILNLNQNPSFIEKIDNAVVNQYLLKDNDIVITLTGTRRKRDYGYVASISGQKNLLLNQRLARLRFHPSLQTKYLLISLQSEHFLDNFFKYETGNVGQGNVSIRAITDEAIPLPPLAEQRRIVAEVERQLSVVAALEATLAANLKRAERLRQAILKRAFEGKLVPQDPSDEPANVLLERIRADRQQEAGGGKRGRRGGPRKARKAEPGAQESPALAPTSNGRRGRPRKDAAQPTERPLMVEEPANGAAQLGLEGME